MTPYTRPDGSLDMHLYGRDRTTLREYIGRPDDPDNEPLRYARQRRRRALPPQAPPASLQPPADPRLVYLAQQFPDFDRREIEDLLAHLDSFSETGEPATWEENGKAMGLPAPPF